MTFFLQMSSGLFSAAEPRRARLAAMVMVLAVLSVHGQDAAPLRKSETPIPQGSYKTWSLFLINNPDWLGPQSAAKIESLYDQFEAFGRAIGPDHVAVWFWKENATAGNAYRAVDVNRAAVFCAKLKLPPSKGPYLVVTSDYPGAGLVADRRTILPMKLTHMGTLQLNNASPEEITHLLTMAADRIASGDLSRLDFNSETYWRGFQQAFDGIRDFLASLKITLTIKTPFLEAQVK